MKNPPINGAVIVETIGKSTGTEVYMGPTRTSSTFKIDAPIFPNGFNPNKVVFFGKEIKIYAKNATVSIHCDGTISTEAVDTWNTEVDANSKKVLQDIETYKLEDCNKEYLNK